MKVCLYSLANVDETGYGGMLKNFTLALFRRGIDLVDFVWTQKCDVQVFIGQPARLLRNFRSRGQQLDYFRRKAPVFLLFSMFEAEVLPDHWAEDINQWFDAVIVPSEWCVETFKKNGVTKPIYKVSLGIDPNLFPYIERPERERFTIIWQGLYFGDRKGRELVRCACEELDILKLRVIEKAVAYLNGQTPHAFWSSTIWSICDTISHLDLLYLLKEADLSVNPTSGESFGLIPLEHMATGLPTIVSDSTGCKDYIDPEYNFGIPCHKGRAFFGPQYGLDDLPDYEKMKELIMQCYEHRGEAKEIGRKASQWVHKNWTWERAADKFLEVIRNVKG